ncbi:hypothetical protein HHE014_15980 [Helicobacter heilmannii]|nr:hypothetical protein HHE014_15980 [Helicobacter heilmannii]
MVCVPLKWCKNTQKQNFNPSPLKGVWGNIPRKWGSSF